MRNFPLASNATLRCSVVPALSIALILAAASPAAALSCIQDRVGEPVNCTANDVRITDFHDIDVVDDGCAFIGDTVTFNAVLTVETSASQRYDIGLFIGVDGRQAMVGQCLVHTLPLSPAPFRNFDNDRCGDTSSSAIVNLPVSNITVTCADANGDNRLDVANCTTWQNNSGYFCNGPSNVEPQTPSKCNCPEVPTDIDIPVPEPLCTNESCNDGQFCNGVETCNLQTGCVPGTPPNCGDPHGCTADSCNEATDSCVHTPNSTLCNDGQFCNGAEICSPTLGCRAGTPPNCGDSVNCTIDACNEATDSCTHAPNSTLCNDGQFCNGAELCTAQGCQAGTPPDCGDSVNCTIDACNEATDSCTHSPNSTLCNDGQFCNGAEICTAQLGCQAGAPPNCADPHECTADTCNEATDSCVHSPNSLLCNDGQFCNGVEMCSPTLGCRPGTAPNCSDTASCTTDACNEATDSCTHTPNNALCTDGQFCNGAEICTDNGCQGGAPPNCDDSVSCTIDACIEQTDSCRHTANNTLCTDGQFCNGTETCVADAGCLPGLPVNCADQFNCTVDTCDETADTCVRTPNNSLCSDGTFCNGTETCSPNAGCQGGTAPNCADTVVCTIDSCNEAADRCDHLPDNSFCGDNDICTTDTCSPLDGCVNTDNSAPCNDGNACTANDHCAAGLCLPGGSVCGDGDVDANCNEVCDPGTREICNNLVDDDGDGLIDCGDPDCAESQLPGCDEACMPIPPCAPLLNDPAIIYTASDEEASSDRAATPNGRFQFHARFVPYTDVDPIADGFIVQLTNAAGEVWRADVQPGDIEQVDGQRYRLNLTIGASNASSGGVTQMRIRRRRDEGLVGYGFRLRAIGDFGRATLPTMTTQVYFGDDFAYLTATWSKKPGRWTLSQRNYE